MINTDIRISDKMKITNLILMCKDNAVFDIDNEKVLNEPLLPGIMKKLPIKDVFMRWMERRYSEGSNTFSRDLRSFVFGQGNQQRVNFETKSLSLSDCYWLKIRNDKVTFKEVSPYYADFWRGEGEYAGQAVPTLYLNGYLPKYWLNKNQLIKDQHVNEIYCSQLAQALGLRTAIVEPYGAKISVRNFTDPVHMFEPANLSGIIHPTDFTTEDILEVFKEFGYCMLFFDALIANGDRHAGNFGFIRDADTGKYLGPAPLFDFDHAFKSKSTQDILIRELKSIKHIYINTHKSLISKLETIALIPYLKERLKAIQSI